MQNGLEVTIRKIHGSNLQYGAVITRAADRNRAREMRVLDLTKMCDKFGLPVEGLTKVLHQQHFGSMIQQREIGDDEPSLSQKIGEWLSETLFPFGSDWDHAADKTQDAQSQSQLGGLEILLDMEPSLGILPWELLDIKCLDVPACIVRLVGAGKPSLEMPKNPAVVFLGQGSVTGYEDLSDAVNEARDTLDKTIGQHLEIIEVPGWRELCTMLIDEREISDRLVALHFVGHGEIKNQKPFLVCRESKENPSPAQVDKGHLSSLLGNTSPLRWLFLVACEAGADGILPSASGLAAGLVGGGFVNCALGMRFPITSRFGQRFSHNFYRAYTSGKNVRFQTAYGLARAAMAPLGQYQSELAAVSLFVNDQGLQASTLPPREPPQPDIHHQASQQGPNLRRSQSAGSTTASAPMSTTHRALSHFPADTKRTQERLVQLTTQAQWNAVEAKELTEELAHELDNARDEGLRRTLHAWLHILKMVRIPAGTYQIGYTQDQISMIADALKTKYSEQVAKQIADQLKAVQPRNIPLRDLLVDRFPVTRDDFRRFIDGNRYETDAEKTGSSKTWRSYAGLDRADFPVVGVSLQDAQAYAKWAGKRLLTSNEWEVLVRCSDARIYPWGWPFSTDLCNTAESLGGEERSAVDRFPEGANEWGCFDLIGNVEEWTSTKDDNASGYRICGGSWQMTCEVFGLAGIHRIGLPDIFTDDLGFRCAKDESDAEKDLFA